MVLPKIKVTVLTKGTRRILAVNHGDNLRKSLLAAGLTPHRGVNEWVNCGGMSVCGSCEVQVLENGCWERKRSCQIRCFHDFETHLE